MHVPRRFYVEALPGIPTIRVFEALACGIPLLSAPWSEAEGLFRPGEDFLQVIFVPGLRGLGVIRMLVPAGLSELPGIGDAGRAGHLNLRGKR